jgi:6-phosphofructokinase 1
MCDHLKEVYKRKGAALVVASEGTEMPAEKGEVAGKDDFGHALLKGREVGETLEKLIEWKTGIETRSAVIGHIQRGGSPTLFDRILGLRVGAKAADLAAKNEWGNMVALRGNDVVGVPLKEATAALKTVPPEWIKFAEIFWK